MNPPETLLVPLLLMACLAGGFTLRAIRHAGWCRAVVWLAVIIAAVIGSSMLMTLISVLWGKVLHVLATVLPVCVMMIPLLGMLVLAWMTGAQLAGGFILLAKQFPK